jgi:hypothetical protein
LQQLALLPVGGTIAFAHDGEDAVIELDAPFIRYGIVWGRPRRSAMVRSPMQTTALPPAPGVADAVPVFHPARCRVLNSTRPLEIAVRAAKSRPPRRIMC